MVREVRNSVRAAGLQAGCPGDKPQKAVFLGGFPRGITPYNAYKGSLRPKGVLFFRLIKRVGKSVVKGALSREFCCFQLYLLLKSLPGTFTRSQNVQMD